MNLIDTHAQVYVDEFEADTTEILQRARAAGVSKILMPAIDRATHTALLALEAKHPDLCVSMMGLHPCSVKENYKEELQAASKLLASREFIAVGEIGLDFYWDKTFVKEQVDAFHQQLDWALQYFCRICFKFIYINMSMCIYQIHAELLCKQKSVKKVYCTLKPH